MQKLLNKRLGITFDGVKTNKLADFGSITRPLSAEENAIMQEMVEHVYDVFITHVSNGRDMNKLRVDSIGQGRVWSGTDAMSLGLIDKFGGLKDAVAIAKEKAGLDNYRILSLPKQEDPFEMIIKQMTGDVRASFLRAEIGDSYKYYQQIKDISEMSGIQARLPFEIEIY